VEESRQEVELAQRVEVEMEQVWGQQSVEPEEGVLQKEALLKTPLPQ